MARGCTKPSRQALRRLQFESLESRQLLAFGVTTGVAPTGQQTFVVDNGADLQFSVIHSGNTSSTIHYGDISSIQYQGQEMLASYGVTSRYSHYLSGLGAAEVTYKIDQNQQWILVTAENAEITQYYAVRQNDNNLYMASHVTAGGESRFIAYLDRNVFTTLEEPSDLNGTNGAIEGGDVFGTPSGETRSKFYNDRRMIDNLYHGVTGSVGSMDVGAWMFMGNREGGSGGPFFKDIDFQSGSAVEIYNYMYSGHTQTEPYRFGLQGPYALQFNDGSLPVAPDYTWMEELGIEDWTPEVERADLSGTAQGMTAGNQTVVGLSNPEAQYWAYADPVTGAYSISGIQAGTYTMTLYDQELEVGTREVTIAAGQSLVVDITNTHVDPQAIWRIGEWDGTPAGFLNADKIANMHPSDVRMSPWVNSTFTVGVDTDADWQMAQFRAVNNSQKITFNLTAAQAATAQTLRIGVTLGFAGGRHQIGVNPGESYEWYSGIPGPTVNLGSRGITRGTYRGVNQTYYYDIPTSALVAGSNTIEMFVVSGSSGDGFLSPNVVFDAIDLVPTATLVNAPAASSVQLSPASSQISAGGQVAFTATVRDQFNNPMAANVEFSTTAGTIDQQGLFTAPETSGTATITARVGQLAAESIVVAFGEAPVVLNPAAASPAVTATGVSSLSVLGDDNQGEGNLTYTWSVLGTAPGGVSFSTNGTNAAKNTTVTLSADGVYQLRVTLQDAQGNTATSDLTVQRGEFVLRYRADETGGAVLGDGSGGLGDANLTGGYSFVSGRSNNAVRFSGGHATLPSGVVSELEDITIAAWVNPTSLATWSRIFDFGDDTTNYMFLTAAGPSGGPRFGIRTPSVVEQIVDSSIALPTNAWSHVAVTLSGNIARLYVNGVQRGVSGSVTLDPSDLGETTANYLAKSQWPDPAFSGALDDYRIYSRALASGELSALAVTQLPATVTGLAAGAGTPGQIDLNWSSAAGAERYNVFRATTSGGTYQLVATVPATSFQDTNPQGSPGGTYFYRIAAENAGGDGPLSSVASATILPPVPAAATNLVASATVAGQLALAWDAATNAASYTVLRGTQPGGPYATVASGITGNTYTDTGLTNQTTYYYQVQSVNASGVANSLETAGTPTDLHALLALNETAGYTAADQSVNQYQGALINGAGWNAAGRIGGALELGRVAYDHAKLPTGFLSELNAATIAVWVNLDAKQDWARIFDFGTGTDANMYLTPSDGGSQRLRFAITAAGIAGEQVIASSYTFPTDAWVHVAVTLDGTSGVMYVNGVEVGRNNAMTLTPSALGQTTRNYLGRSQYASDPYLFGKLDDFRVYSRALTAGEVASLTNVPVLPGDFNRDNTVDGRDYALWRETLGTAVATYSAADASGNGQIDSSDLTIWKANYGRTVGSSGFAPQVAPAPAPLVASEPPILPYVGAPVEETNIFGRTSSPTQQAVASVFENELLLLSALPANAGETNDDASTFDLFSRDDQSDSQSPREQAFESLEIAL